MKIALDLHGVLSDWEFMTPIVHELTAEGHELYVVSGAPKRQLEKEIVELGYQVEWFKGVYSIIDWLLDSNAPGKIWHNEKGWWYDDDIRWQKTKAEIAEFYEIDILLDDQEKYKQGYLKPGTFTLYSTFKSFKGWKDPSSFLLQIASYYRPAPPWKLVAKEDVPVQKLEPPTGRIFFADFKYNNPTKVTLYKQSKDPKEFSTVKMSFPRVKLEEFEFEAYHVIGDEQTDDPYMIAVISVKKFMEMYTSGKYYRNDYRYELVLMNGKLMANGSIDCNNEVFIIHDRRRSWTVEELENEGIQLNIVLCERPSD